jgi:DNA modification methylase
MPKQNSLQPEQFELETTTVWDFPRRGDWATHQSNYRGNFAPQIPRNLLLNYTEEGEIILDPMVGSGTTLIECKLLNRNGIGYDINPHAVEITQQRLSFRSENSSQQTVSVGDVRNLSQIEDNSIDMVITHPPYLDLVTYSNGENPDDLSSISNIPCFFQELSRGVAELFRVLKPGRFCAILMGDTRKGQHFVPLSLFTLRICLKKGFVLKEDIIKTQHNTTYALRWSGNAKKYKFYLIMHEHLFVLRKPKETELTSKWRYSTWDGWKELIE